MTNNTIAKPIRKTAMQTISKASAMPVWAKILVYGETSTGKTVNGLMMPPPVLVIDTEKGSVHYGEAYDFYVQRTRELSLIKQTLFELKENKCYLVHYDDDGNEVDRTRIMSIVFDSGTTLYNLINQYWVQKFQRDSKNPVYKLEGGDYTYIKNDLRHNFINPLLDMEVHLYMICQLANKYIKGTYMKIDPNDPDRPNIEDSVPYDFDVVMRMEKKGDDYRAVVNKSRIIDPKTRKNALPDVFEHVDVELFIPELIKFIQKRKIHDRSNEEKKEMEIKTNTEIQLDGLRQQIYDLVAKLGWDNAKAANEMKQQIDESSTKSPTLTVEKAQKFIAYLLEQLPQENASTNDIDSTPTDEV